MPTLNSNEPAPPPWDTAFPGAISALAGAAMWLFFSSPDTVAFGFLLFFVAVGAGIYSIAVSRAFRRAGALGWIGNILAGAWLLVNVAKLTS